MSSSGKTVVMYKSNFYLIGDTILCNLQMKNDNCIGMSDFRMSSVHKTALYRAFHIHYFLAVYSLSR
jgi:hypothetical protein